MTIPVRRGTHRQLEDVADQILRTALSGEKRRSLKSDILTPWKDHDRRKREIFVTSGTPDASMRKGDFHRVANPNKPELNSREGHAPARTSGASGLSEFMGGYGASVGSSGSTDWDDYA